jgi:hypothetical protein
MRVSDKRDDWRDVSVIAAIMIGGLFLVMLVLFVAMILWVK